MREDQSKRNRNWTLVALMLAMALGAMDSTIVSTAIPQIVADLGGFSKFTWVFSIYLLAQTITIPLYGKLSDIYGRKRILIFGIIVFILGSAASGAAWDIVSLITFHGIQGLGAGSIMATINTIAGDLYTVKERAKIQGLLSSIWGMSAILGPTLGGALTEYAHWRWIFLINIPFGILSIQVLLKHYKEDIHPTHPQIDYKGAILLMLTLSLILIYLMEGGQSWPWFGTQGNLLLIAIGTFSTWTYHIEKRSKEAIMPAWLWSNKTLALTSLSMAGMGIVMMGPETFLPTFAQASLNMGIIASGFVLASMSLGWPVSSALSGKLYMRIGFRNTSLMGTLLIILSSIGFLLIPYPQAFWLLVIDQILLGAGFGLLSTAALVGPQSMVSWEQRGVVTGAIVFARNLGQSLGAVIFGAIFNSSLTRELSKSPSDLFISHHNVLKYLHSPEVAESTKTFIQHCMNTAMSHIYWVVILLSILILCCILLTEEQLPKADAIDPS